MRKWGVFAAVGVLSGILTVPSSAQQRAGASADDSKSSDTAAANAPAAPSADFKIVPIRGAFALPAAPRSTPFPGPSSASKDDSAPGLLAPKFEIAGMFQYINFAPGSPFANFNTYGSTASFTYNPSKWIGLTGEYGGYHFSRNLDPLTGTTQGATGNLYSYLFGPRLNLRKFQHFVPFAEFLVGGAHGTEAIEGTQSQSTFAIAPGGGLDIVLTKNLAWRFAELNYFMTNFSGSGVGATGRQNNFRAGSGLVARFGNPKAPPPPANRPPVAACSANPTSVYAGSGDTVGIHVNASDPDNDPLTYSYTATGGSVEGTGPDARWSSSGVAVGTYTVNVKVDDGRGGIASCSVDITVGQRPNRPPTASLSIERNSLLPGERTGVTCNGSDPDGDPLTYSYTVTGGQIVGSGSNVQFDSTGLAPGSYTISCTVDDGRGGTAQASGNVEVKEPPQVKQLETRLSLHSIYFPTAQPTVEKPMGGLLASQAGTLDTLAADFKQYLQYRPAAHLILEGHADSRGEKEYNIKLSERRVERTKSYLIEHGVPVDHIETKAFGFEKNMTAEEVKALIEQDTQLTAQEKVKILTNLITVRMANNRRVDVTLSTTGQQSVRQYPFNSKDVLTLLSRKGGEKEKSKAAPAPKKPAKP